MLALGAAPPPPRSPGRTPPSPAYKESRHVQCRRRAERGRPRQQCPRRGGRKNGAKSRGPKTLEGKERSAQNALRLGTRAKKYVVLPDQDAVEFAQLQTALFEEQAPIGPLQTVLAHRVALAAWRLARADRIETEPFAERRWSGGALALPWSATATAPAAPRR